jgi:hypothetical protein
MALKGNVDPAGDTRLSDRFKDGGLPFVAMDAEPLISLRMSRPNKRFSVLHPAPVAQPQWLRRTTASTAGTGVSAR